MEEGPVLDLTGHAPTGQDGPQMGDDGAEQMCYDGRVSNQGAGQEANFWMSVVTLETTASRNLCLFQKGPSGIHLSPHPAPM